MPSGVAVASSRLALRSCPALCPAAAMYDPECGWSLSFGGSGFLGLYYVGATHCLRERAPYLLHNACMILGSSAGALHAATFLSGIPLGASRAAGTPRWEGASARLGCRGPQGPSEEPGRVTGHCECIL